MGRYLALPLLFAVAALLAYLWLRRRQLAKEFQAMLRERRFVHRKTCPVPAPFVYEKLFSLICYDGELQPGLPMTLMLGVRHEGVGKSRHTYYYTGFYFPPQTNLSDRWLSEWKKKVVERGDGWAVHSGVEETKRKWGLKGPPDSLPIRATRFEDGAVILAWYGLQLRKNIEARIREVVESLANETQGQAMS